MQVSVLIVDYRVCKSCHCLSVSCVVLPSSHMLDEGSRRFLNREISLKHIATLTELAHMIKNKITAALNAAYAAL